MVMLTVTGKNVDNEKRHGNDNYARNDNDNIIIRRIRTITRRTTTIISAPAARAPDAAVDSANEGGCARAWPVSVAQPVEFRFYALATRTSQARSTRTAQKKNQASKVARTRA